MSLVTSIPAPAVLQLHKGLCRLAIDKRQNQQANYISPTRGQSVPHHTVSAIGVEIFGTNLCAKCHIRILARLSSVMILVIQDFPQFIQLSGRWNVYDAKSTLNNVRRNILNGFGMCETKKVK
jgi:hypothetical protein